MSIGLAVIGFAAFSGTGKTSLLIKLIPALNQLGYSVAVIKHAHHTFDIDYPKKDSYKLRAAGATQMLVSSAKRFVKIAEQTKEKTLYQCLEEIDTKTCDLILVEGFKHSSIKKIELHRPSLGFALLAKTDPDIIAVATDSDLHLKPGIQQLDLNNIKQIAEFIAQNLSRFELD